MTNFCFADSATSRTILGSTTILTGSALALTFMFAAPRSALAADEPIRLDEVSVTATKVERATKDVPATIAVIGSQRIEQEKMFNISDAIDGTPGVLINSKNGGFDVRLVIRGAGQKANYGVREIMVLRDGVPMTDPDSFTRFDFIDTQDIERIEITKGPGSIYGGGSAGGTIQILSKSVFDEQANRVRLGAGTSEQTTAHTRFGGMIGDSDAVSMTISRRAVGNNWRRWNEFETTQTSFKHGHTFNDGATLENELSYSIANMQLPGSMNQALFQSYLKTGKQTDAYDAWKHSGRDSKTWFFNTRYEKEMGDFTFKPRFYWNHWGHFHPVTGAINVSESNYIYGTDLEGAYKHQLWGDSSLVAGVSVRRDESLDSLKYAYRDYVDVTNTFRGTGRIKATLNDEPGELIKKGDLVNTMFGAYAQESFRPTSLMLVDVGLRYDLSVFDTDEVEMKQYSYSSGKYITGDGVNDTDVQFHLFSPKIGISYALTDAVSLYGSVAQSDQVPSASEISSNNNLQPAQSRGFEMGFKGRDKKWSFDFAAYYNWVEDEIVSVYGDGGETTFTNAGKVRKRGLEFAGDYEVLEGLRLGASYALSDYVFEKYEEAVSGANVDRSGNRMPYVPKHQYGLSLSYLHESGIKARVQSTGWGSYHMDNANTEKYRGYHGVTDVSLGYEDGPDSFSLNIDNIFDKRYAVEAKKGTTGTVTYSGAQPRTFMLTYNRKF